VGPGIARVSGKAFGVDGLIAENEFACITYRADAIFIATHSQGCPVSTLLLDKLIQEGHISNATNIPVSPLVPGVIESPLPRTKAQRVCLLGMCGVHHGPLRWLHNSNVVNPYITYFESPAARELFDFQVCIASNSFLRVYI
jgi:hypothetical protein